MRSRLSIFLDELTLEEILLLDEELERRKEKHRRVYSVLVIQTDRTILRWENSEELNQFTRNMRRLVTNCGAVGNGSLLAFSPEVSVILLTSVASACRVGSAMLSSLPELNGRSKQDSMRVRLKMGLATGVDTLAPGSHRSVRQSAIVKRANEAAWRSAPNEVLMDEASYFEWPEKLAAVATNNDLDGHRMYRAVPGLLSKENPKYKNEELIFFLRKAAEAGIPTLKYDLEHTDSDQTMVDAEGQTVGMVQITIEGYDAASSRNLVLRENIAVPDLQDRMDVVKRFVGTMGLALVRHDMMTPEIS